MQVWKPLRAFGVSRNHPGTQKLMWRAVLVLTFRHDHGEPEAAPIVKREQEPGGYSMQGLAIAAVDMEQVQGDTHLECDLCGLLDPIPDDTNGLQSPVNATVLDRALKAKREQVGSSDWRKLSADFRDKVRLFACDKGEVPDRVAHKKSCDGTCRKRTTPNAKSIFQQLRTRVNRNLLEWRRDTEYGPGFG